MFEIKMHVRCCKNNIEKLINLNDRFLEVSIEDDEITLRTTSYEPDFVVLHSINVKDWMAIRYQYICENVVNIVLAENYDKKAVKRAIFRLLSELPYETCRPTSYEDTLVLIQEDLIKFIRKKFPKLYAGVGFSGNYDTWDKAGVVYLDLDKKTATIVNFDEKAEVKTNEKVLFRFRHRYADGSPSAWWHGNEEVVITEDVVDYLSEHLDELAPYVRLVIAFEYVITRLY